MIEPAPLRSDPFEEFFRTRSERLLAAIARAMGKQVIDDEDDETECWLPDRRRPGSRRTALCSSELASAPLPPGGDRVWMTLSSRPGSGRASWWGASGG